MSLFDFTKSKFIFDYGDNTAIDTEGTLYTRVSDDFAMDLETGELDFIIGWDSHEDGQDDLW